MSRTTDDILTVAQRAMEIGRRCLPTYSNPFSPRKFTQPQLFAVLVVRQALGWTYRQTSARLREWSELRQLLQLAAVPEQSTLCCAHRRLLSEDTSLGCLMQACGRPRNVA